MHIYDKPDLPTVLVDHLLIMKKEYKNSKKLDIHNTFIETN